MFAELCHQLHGWLCEVPRCQIRMCGRLGKFVLSDQLHLVYHWYKIKLFMKSCMAAMTRRVGVLLACMRFACARPCMLESCCPLFCCLCMLGSVHVVGQGINCMHGFAVPGSVSQLVLLSDPHPPCNHITYHSTRLSQAKTLPAANPAGHVGDFAF